MAADRTHANTSALARVPLLAGLPGDELARLERRLARSRHAAGRVLFREGDRGDRLFVVIDGAVAIIKAMDTPDERLLAIRGAGEFVGEMGLLDPDGRRTASVRADCDTETLEITPADLDALLHRHPAVAFEMLRIMSMRLRDAQNATIRDLHHKNERLAQAYADLQAAQAQIIEQRTLERELLLAKDIQLSMLPRRLPQVAGIDVGARMVAARMVGGDFYDVLPMPDGRLGLVIGDASGKGVPAALFMALACSLVRAEAARGGPPEEVLQAVNRQLFSMNERGMFATVLFAVIDVAARSLTLVRAGHELPLLWHGDGTAIGLRQGRAMPLGLFPRATLDSQTVDLPPGSLLLLYTDGVTDATDEQDQMFGLERVTAMFAELRPCSAPQLVARIVETLDAYQRGHPPADDITLIAARIG
jgi:phosphoserine phosphatase RsbU/P